MNHTIVDAYAPAQIARLIEESGVRKAALQTVTLGVLAGAFIAFLLGLVLVVVVAELFTGNNLISMAWADWKVSTAALLRGGIDWLALAGNLVPVTVGNIVGGSVFFALVYWIVYLRGGSHD